MVSSKPQILLLVTIARLLHFEVNCSSDIAFEVHAETLDVFSTTGALIQLHVVEIFPQLPHGIVTAPPPFHSDTFFTIYLTGWEPTTEYDLHVVTDNGFDRHIILNSHRILQIAAATTTQDIPVIIYEKINVAFGMSFFNLRRDGKTVYTHSSTDTSRCINYCITSENFGSDNLVMDSNGYGLAVYPDELKPAASYNYDADYAVCPTFNCGANYEYHVTTSYALCTRAAAPVDVSVVDSGEGTVIMKFKRNPDNVATTNGFRITSSPNADIPQPEDNIEQVEIGNLTSWVVYTFNISQKFNCTGSLQDGESDFDLSSEPVTIIHLVRGYGASSDTSGNTKESCNHVTAIITALSLLCFISAIAAIAMAVILFVSLRPNNKVTDENFVNLRNARSLTIIDKCHIKIVKNT